MTKKLRSAAWFDNPANIDVTALYLERYLNFGLRNRGTVYRFPCREASSPAGSGLVFGAFFR